MKEKIVSLVCSYNIKDMLLFDKIISELNKYSKVILFTAEDYEFNNVSEIYRFDKSIERDLVYEPRKWIVNNINSDWDYALYTEDDILISEQSVHNVISLYTKLSKPYVPGFIRYEFDPRDRTKRYIDMHPAHGIHRGSFGIVKNAWEDLEIWEPRNLHSGAWIFSKSDIQDMIEAKIWEQSYKEYGHQYGKCDQLESAASIPYTFYVKVYPNDLESVEIEHTIPKYIYLSKNPQLNEILQHINIYKNVTSNT